MATRKGDPCGLSWKLAITVGEEDMQSLGKCCDEDVPQGASCGSSVLPGKEEVKLELSPEGKELWLGV